MQKEAPYSSKTTPEMMAFVWPSWSSILVSPVLYVMVIPLIFLDFCLELYHRTVFPLLGIPRVHRWEYIRIDRHRLSFLPVIFKVACAYCGYANGLLQYAVQIAGVTETYFCPMKHKPAKDFHPPIHQQHFVPYGDARGFQHRVYGITPYPNKAKNGSL